MNNSSYDTEAVNEFTKDNNWIYFGGDQNKTAYDNVGTHYKYFCQISTDYFGHIKHIPHDDRCVCNHKIFQNCYIYNTKTDEFRVIGNCCIKKFNLQGKTCSRCKAPHKNRKDNYCKDCRVIIKKEEEKKMLCACGRKKKYEWSKICVGCYLEHRNGYH